MAGAAVTARLAMRKTGRQCWVLLILLMLAQAVADAEVSTQRQSVGGSDGGSGGGAVATHGSKPVVLDLPYALAALQQAMRGGASDYELVRAADALTSACGSHSTALAPAVASAALEALGLAASMAGSPVFRGALMLERGRLLQLLEKAAAAEVVVEAAVALLRRQPLPTSSHSAPAPPADPTTLALQRWVLGRLLRAARVLHDLKREQAAINVLAPLPAVAARLSDPASYVSAVGQLSSLSDEQLEQVQSCTAMLDGQLLLADVGSGPACPWLQGFSTRQTFPLYYSLHRALHARERYREAWAALVRAKQLHAPPAGYQPEDYEALLLELGLAFPIPEAATAEPVAPAWPPSAAQQQRQQQEATVAAGAGEHSSNSSEALQREGRSGITAAAAVAEVPVVGGSTGWLGGILGRFGCRKAQQGAPADAPLARQVLPPEDLPGAEEAAAGEPAPVQASSPPPQDGLRFILVVGLPRSGSEVIEQILRSHPEVWAAGERSWLPHMLDQLLAETAATGGVSVARRRSLRSEYVEGMQGLVPPEAAAGGKASWILDKNVGSALRLGLIDRLLPDACILHAVRHPADTALSILQQAPRPASQPWAFNLTHLASHVDAHHRAMAHWERALPGRAMHVHYSHMVADMEGTTRHMLQHCGLSWHPAMLRLPDIAGAAEAAATTGPEQARRSPQPPAKWRAYAEGLAPLLLQLGDVILDYEKSAGLPSSQQLLTRLQQAQQQSQHAGHAEVAQQAQQAGQALAAGQVQFDGLGQVHQREVEEQQLEDQAWEPGEQQQRQREQERVEEQQRLEERQRHLEEQQRLAEDQMQLEEQKRQLEQQQLFVEEQRQAEIDGQAKVERQRQAEQEQQAERNRQAEQMRRAQQLRLDEQEREAERQRLEEQQLRLSEEHAQLAQQQRLAEQQRLTVQQQLAEQQRMDQQQRLLAEQEQRRLQELLLEQQRRLQEQQRLEEQDQLAEQQRVAEQQWLEEQQRVAEHQRSAEEAHFAEQQQREEERFAEQDAKQRQQAEQQGLEEKQRLAAQDLEQQPKPEQQPQQSEQQGLEEKQQFAELKRIEDLERLVREMERRMREAEQHKGPAGAAQHQAEAPVGGPAAPAAQRLAEEGGAAAGLGGDEPRDDSGTGTRLGGAVEPGVGAREVEAAEAGREAAARKEAETAAAVRREREATLVAAAAARMAARREEQAAAAAAAEAAAQREREGVAEAIAVAEAAALRDHEVAAAHAAAGQEAVDVAAARTEQQVARAAPGADAAASREVEEAEAAADEAEAHETPPDVEEAEAEIPSDVEKVETEIPPDVEEVEAEIPSDVEKAETEIPPDVEEVETGKPPSSPTEEPSAPPQQQPPQQPAQELSIQQQQQQQPTQQGSSQQQQQQQQEDQERRQLTEGDAASPSRVTAGALGLRKALLNKDKAAQQAAHQAQQEQRQEGQDKATTDVLARGPSANESVALAPQPGTHTWPKQAGQQVDQQEDEQQAAAVPREGRPSPGNPTADLKAEPAGTSGQHNTPKPAPEQARTSLPHPAAAQTVPQQAAAEQPRNAGRKLGVETASPPIHRAAEDLPASEPEPAFEPLIAPGLDPATNHGRESLTEPGFESPPAAVEGVEQAMEGQQQQLEERQQAAGTCSSEQAAAKACAVPDS